MNVLIIIFAFGGFLRYELFGTLEDEAEWKKQAVTFQFKADYEDENFYIYGSFDAIFDALEEEKFYLRPIEGYFSYSGSFYEITLGKKIYSFGKANWLNPTDIITPWDYSKLYSTLEEFREGIESAKISLWKGPLALSLFYFTNFRENNYPIPYLAFPVPMGPETLNFVFNTNIKEKPERKLKNFEGGARLTLLLSGFDITFSYFNLYDRDPDLGIRGTPDSLILWLKYNKISLLGFDFSKTKDVYEFHGELSYVLTEDDDGINSQIKNPYIYGIIGAGRSFFDKKIYFEIQTGAKRIINYKPPEEFGMDKMIEENMQKISFQTDKIFYYITADMQIKLLNERLKFHIPLIYDITNQDYFSLSRISYDFGKGINFGTGLLLSGGKGYSPFSEMGKHVGDLFFVEMKYSF